MSRLMRRVITLASCLIITCSLAAVARADYTTASPLLNNLNQILRDPEKKVAMSPDRSAVIFMSKHAEVSFGADCQMRLQDPGTFKRMTDLTKGFSVNMGEALGHKGKQVPNAISCLVKLVKDRGMNWKLRSNGIGFSAKSYSPKTRPMDMWCSSMKFSIAPGGACTIKQIKRGPLGFGGTAPKQTLEGTPRISTAVGRPIPRPTPQRRSRAFAPTHRTSFRPVAISNFKVMSGGKRASK